ncbi:lasso RiPP family leader peptide-containing protein [Streptomyces abikoensis]
MEQNDIVQEMVYESPELVEVGGFAEVTLGGGSMWADYLTAMDY